MSLPLRAKSFASAQALLRPPGECELRKQLLAYAFLLPALIVFSLFAWYPIIKGIEMSFQNVSLSGDSTWVGLDNYALMLKDPAFAIAWRNSLQFALWSLLLGYLLPIVIAILVREMRHAQGFFRVVYFLPTVVPGAIAIIIWRFLYDPDAGVLNAILTQMGFSRQFWLSDAALVKPAIVAMMTWSGFGTTALIYLSTAARNPDRAVRSGRTRRGHPAAPHPPCRRCRISTR